MHKLYLKNQLTSHVLLHFNTECDQSIMDDNSCISSNKNKLDKSNSDNESNLLEEDDSLSEFSYKQSFDDEEDISKDESIDDKDFIEINKIKAKCQKRTKIKLDKK